LKKFFVIPLLILVSINTYGDRDFNFDNFPALKTNSFIWGQVTGCVYRYKKYTEISSESEDEQQSKKKLLNNIVGNTSEMFDVLMKIGHESGFLGKDSITKEGWETLIGNIAVSEYEDGASWLQAVGCLKMLDDYMIFDKPS